MIICGIDPGTRQVGYSVLRFSPARIEILDLGVWKLMQLCGSDATLGTRFEKLFEVSSEFFAKWNPHRVGMEKAVAFKNIPSALKLSEARGILRLALYQTLDRADERLWELSPTEIKKKASGRGLAQKKEISKVMFMRFPTLQSVKGVEDFPPDAYDALAIAWTLYLKEKASLMTSRLSHKKT